MFFQVNHRKRKQFIELYKQKNTVYSINGALKSEPSGNKAETPQINMFDWKNVIEDTRKEFSETGEL